MELAAPRPNVELGAARSGEPVVVFAFPYDAALVDAMRAIPGRRFDWDAKEWLVPQHEVTAIYVADVIDRWPQLLVSDGVQQWLAGMPRGWLARITTRKHEGRGEFVARTLAGPLPEELEAHATELVPRTHTLPFAEEVADFLLEHAGAKLDPGSAGCATRLRVGIDPPPAVLVIEHTVEEPMFALDKLWDDDAVAAFGLIPGADARASRVPVDAWALEGIEHFLRTHGIEVAPSARPTLKRLREEHEAAAEAIRRSRSRTAEPPDPKPALGGTLAPFQWAGVRYALDVRRTFIADEQGLGKTVQALAALEADHAFPAVVVCPASLKLTWEREAERWLPHRTRAVVSGRQSVPPRADLTIVNYDIVADHRSSLLRARPRALVLDESHYCKNPRAKRTKAVRQLADGLPENGLRLALSGTPVTNGPGEIVPQLRILGRLEEFGTGARLERRFKGNGGEERLHWHLRRRCFVRRLKKDVLPQLPAKRRVVVPVALTNEDEYRLAERDVVAWLRTQPFERLSELDAKIARTLRAERLAQLNALKQLAARGKLAAAVAWIHDFLESGEPLIVFAHHREVQRAVLERFPDAGHLVADDSTAQRAETVDRFQNGDGPGLLVCSTRVAGHGITLTRASNVAFLELGWTPAEHDQAEDRCHRIGQHDAVTAWYLLAADTIDETIAELLEGKRGVVDAVTDGRRVLGESLVEQVSEALRGGAPRRHLRTVA